jgi:hypothetical protein
MMKAAVLHTRSDARAARSHLPVSFDTSYARFGDDLLLFGKDSSVEETTRLASTYGWEVREDPTTLRDRPYLVVQIGNLFQRTHPDVPVLLNKGRYLAVSLLSEQAEALMAEEEPCYTIRPLEDNEVVFRIARATAARAQSVTWVRDIVNNLSRERLEQNLAHLVSYTTRRSTSSQYPQAAEWAQAQLSALGYTTRLAPIAVGTRSSCNVIADKPGGGTSERHLIIVTAHLDSINIAGGPAGVAPGADDNGSGSAGLLEIAHLLREQRTTHDLRFILFGGEEQGLYGSKQYVASLAALERQRIRAVLNMDMVATVNTALPTVLIEGAGVSRTVIDGLVSAASAYTQLTVQTSLEPYNSDHVPFIDAGIPAVLTIEGTDSANSNVHTASDTLDHIRYDLMLEILRMNTAFIAEAVGQEGERAMFTNHDQQPFASANTNLGNELIAALRNLPFQFSGRYTYNGGASARAGRGFVDVESGQSTVALTNPIYRLDEPVYVHEDDGVSLAERSTDELRFTLHVDIDGNNPLNVVSGTVALGPSIPGVAFPHFIGRVSSHTQNVGGLTVTVDSFKFGWPDSIDNIDQLTIELSGSPLINPTAKVTFEDTMQHHSFGPYVAMQESMDFREVEVEVDREANAVPVEPVSTSVHPDRPTDLPEEELTLEKAFAKAGVRITRSSRSGTVTDGAGTDNRWNYAELHDSMQLHWAAFANKPQWKMWIFLAELADSDSLGGVMFDGEIDEPGGVDRQGTAIFTRCPFFHTVQGEYIRANPPEEEAVRRELFFNLIHETGHAFNLAHSFQKGLGGGWKAPSWMPMRTNNQALSWMNYPDSATPGGAGFNASWFYKRFRFTFDSGELLFLRHAPETYVEMGGEAWFQNHGRVARTSVDNRLELKVRSLKQMYEYGEPVLVELRLRNVSGQTLTVSPNLDPSDGLVEIAVTNPRGERRPFLPVDHTRTILVPVALQPGGAGIYQSVDLTMGSYGFSFKEPGAYRIEASFTNAYGGAAAAVMQIYVRSPANYDVVPIVHELFDARVGLTLYVEGTRVLEEVNDKLDWVNRKLSDEVGAHNPISRHLTTVRFKPLATPSKVVDPSTRSIRAYAEEPDIFVRELHPVIMEQPEVTANTMGHIWYKDVVDAYTEAAITAGEVGKAEEAQQQMIHMFKKREVVSNVVGSAESRLKDLKAGTMRSGEAVHARSKK